MDIKSLENLTKNGKTYELATTVLGKNKNYAIYSFICEPRHNMRIDLVCEDIYNNTDSIDILMTLNGIYNPLVIQDGDEIFFIEDLDLNVVRDDTRLQDAIIEKLKGANKGKQFKTDKNRIKDLSKRTQTEKQKNYIPPNINSNGATVVYENGKITYKPNF
jgi:hypothetical protein